jgi:DNA polymerase III alpha subunit
MLYLEDRILLNNGTSIVTDEYAVRKLLEGGELPSHIIVGKSDDSDLYDLMYKSNISISEINEEVTPKIICDMHYGDIIDELIGTHRDDTDESLHKDRLAKEIDFFVKSDNMSLLGSIKALIKQFKSDNIVWGVGRGSSCASYVLYLLEVHDVNPILFSIPFSEFSKEQ